MNDTDTPPSNEDLHAIIQTQKSHSSKSIYLLSSCDQAHR